MKNKDKYDLNNLSVDIGYLTNGCGKKIEGKLYITIKENGKRIRAEETNLKPIEYLFKWLETEEKNEH